MSTDKSEGCGPFLNALAGLNGVQFSQPIRFKGCPGTECRLLAINLPGPTPFVVADRDAGTGGLNRRWAATTYSAEEFVRQFENVPPAPREWWLSVDHSLVFVHPTQQAAVEFNASRFGYELVHVREMQP